MSRALGPKALALLERWEADGTRVVSIKEVRERLGSGVSPPAATQMVRRLRDAGFLKRVGRGVYAVQPLAWMGESAPDVAVVLAAIAELCVHRRSVRLQKRLGFLCERAGWTWSEPAVAVLRSDWPSSHRAVLDSTRGREGRWDSTWGLVVNVPEALLHAEAGVR